MAGEILCIGGVMVDVSTFMLRIPRFSESALASDCIVGFGGKAGNQAIAISRLGGCVTFVGRVGDDSFGKNYIEHFKKHEINTKFVTESHDVSSGVAQIFVNEKTGQNMIIGVLGANLKVSEEDIRVAESAIKAAKVVSVSLDIPLPAALEALRLARSANVTTVINIAPLDSAKQLAADQSSLDELLTCTSFLCLNETEALCFSQLSSDLGVDKCIKGGVRNYCDADDQQKASVKLKLNGLSPCGLRLVNYNANGETNGVSHVMSGSTIDMDDDFGCSCEREAPIRISQSANLSKRITDSLNVMSALQHVAARSGNRQFVPIITLGEDGLVYNEPLNEAGAVQSNGHAPDSCTCGCNHNWRYIPAPRVAAKDSCGASDALIAAFVLLRARTNATKLREQLRRAVHFASLTVTRHGTQSSYPFLHELFEQDRALYLNSPLNGSHT